jgi:hypothetical protein
MFFDMDDAWVFIFKPQQDGRDHNRFHQKMRSLNGKRIYEFSYIIDPQGKTDEFLKELKDQNLVSNSDAVLITPVSGLTAAQNFPEVEPWNAQQQTDLGSSGLQ